MRLLNVVAFSKKLRWLAQTKVISLTKWLRGVAFTQARVRSLAFHLCDPNTNGCMYWDHSIYIIFIYFFLPHGKQIRCMRLSIGSIKTFQMTYYRNGFLAIQFLKGSILRGILMYYQHKFLID